MDLMLNAMCQPCCYERSHNGLIESSQQLCLVGTTIISIRQERKWRPREMR